MKAFGLVGSPIAGGNVDILVDQVLAGAASRGAATTKVILNELTIRPCQSCGPPEGGAFCRVEDGMAVVYRELERSDIIILGSPVYFDTVSAQVKLMIDRCNCFAPLVRGEDGERAFRRRFLRRRKGVLVAVAGLDQDFGPIRTTVDGFFTWLSAELAGTVLYAHRDTAKGGVQSVSEWLRRAFDVGAQVASGWDTPGDAVTE